MHKPPDEQHGIAILRPVQRPASGIGRTRPIASSLDGGSLEDWKGAVAENESRVGT
ncbi:MAG TPA: hypothetical protein VGI45_29025 [Terracidiphilus sp.]